MTQPDRLGGRLSRRQDWWFVAGLLLLAVVLPVVVGAIAGSLEIPRNDDWSYRRIAIDLAQTGRFALDGISETMAVGQILFVQPFLRVSGLQPWAFTAAGVVFATGGILGAYALARRVLPAREAAVAAGLLAIFPGYLAYATSFMSDVPALAAEFLCLALGAVAVRRPGVRFGWLLVAAATGILAFSVREFAVAALASVMLAAICAEPRRARHWALAVGVAASCVGIHIWRSTLPGQLGPVGPGFGSIDRAILALTTVAFVVSPAALVGAIRWRAHLRRSDVLLGLGIGAALVAVRLLRWFRDGAMPPMINDNLASQYGAPGGYLDGNRPELFSDAVWVLVNVMALAAAVIVLGLGTGIAGAHIRRCERSIRALTRRLGSPLGIVALFCLAVAGGLLLFSFSRPVFDRYFWPLVPPIAVLFLYVPRDLAPGSPSRRRSNLILAGCAMAITTVLATTSLVYLLNSYAFGAVRWRAGEQLVHAGVRADEIDAGFEWVGYHATSQGDPTQTSTDVTFYRSWWPSFKICGLVTSAEQVPTDAILIGTINYELDLVGGPTETLYLYRINSSACPPG